MLRLPKYKYYFAAADVFIIIASFTIAVFMNISKLEFIQVKTRLYLSLISFFILLVFGFVSETQRLYKRNLILKRKEHTAAISKAVIYSTVLTFIISLISFSDFAQYGFFTTFVISAFILFYVLRVEILRSLLIKLGKRNLLIIGSGEQGQKIAEFLKAKETQDISLVATLNHFGSYNNLKHIIDTKRVDEILISPSKESYDEILEIIDRCRLENVTVKLVSEKFRVIQEKIPVEKYYNIPVIDVTRKYEDRTLYVLKRVTDLVAAGVGLIVLSPLFLLLALTIKLTSKGPAIYKQKRVGIDGKRFDLYKFRSMTSMAGEDEKRKDMMLEFMKNNKAQKVINDVRVTPIGKLIRKSSLDELPQLINVLKGDMSLVGPRPCLPYEFENYEKWQKRRVKVLPGCTGVWQVTGRSAVNFNDSILLDLYYINARSPMLDVKLIMKTLPVMILSKGGK